MASPFMWVLLHVNVVHSLCTCAHRQQGRWNHVSPNTLHLPRVITLNATLTKVTAMAALTLKILKITELYFFIKKKKQKKQGLDSRHLESGWLSPSPENARRSPVSHRSPPVMAKGPHPVPSTAPGEPLPVFRVSTVSWLWPARLRPPACQAPGGRPSLIQTHRGRESMCWCEGRGGVGEPDYQMRPPPLPLSQDPLLPLHTFLGAPGCPPPRAVGRVPALMQHHREKQRSEPGWGDRRARGSPSEDIQD